MANRSKRRGIEAILVETWGQEFYTSLPPLLAFLGAVRRAKRNNNKLVQSGMGFEAQPVAIDDPVSGCTCRFLQEIVFIRSWDNTRTRHFRAHVKAISAFHRSCHRQQLFLPRGSFFLLLLLYGDGL